MDFNQVIEKYVKDYKDIDILAPAKKHGEVGNLDHLYNSIEVIKELMNIFIGIDTKDFAQESINEISSVINKFNDIARQIEKSYKGEVDKDRVTRDIKSLEKLAIDVLPKYEFKLNKILSKQQEIAREVIEEGTKTIQERVVGGIVATEFLQEAEGHEKSNVKWGCILTGVCFLTVCFTLATMFNFRVCTEKEVNSIKEISCEYGLFEKQIEKNDILNHLPIYVVFGTLLTLSYVIFKDNRKRYYQNKINHILFNKLDFYLKDRSTETSKIIVDSIFSRIRESDTKVSTFDAVNVAGDFISKVSPK